MHDPALLIQPAFHVGEHRIEHLQRAIEHAVHLLPTQGPITVFVHHNTLHAFEEWPFEQAVQKGLETYGCQPFLPEEKYHAFLASGRIRPDDITAVVKEVLGDDANERIGFMGTRQELQVAILEHPSRTGSGPEIHWLIAETDALNRFRKEVSTATRGPLVQATRQWVERILNRERSRVDDRLHAVLEVLFQRFRKEAIASWSEAVWESFTLHLLWQICQHGVHGVPRTAAGELETIRHCALLRLATGIDPDDAINETLIRFCAAFLDQGYAHWRLPERDRGFLQSFCRLYRNNAPAESWAAAVVDEIRAIEQADLNAFESIDRSLRQLGVKERELETFITQTLLALPGWTGMLWQMETNAEWTVHPAPDGTLVEYLAVRLILECVALKYFARDLLEDEGDLGGLRSKLRKQMVHNAESTLEQRAFAIFQLAQVRGWSNPDLFQLSKADWVRLVQEIETFSSFQRRRLYHRAYERWYRIQALDAIHLHRSKGARCSVEKPSFQAITCIDDREESFRRHLEEIDPSCQTFGAPGFFAVAIYYQGAAEAYYRPLCPVVVKPQHYVREVVAYSLTSSSRQREETRRTLGTASHHWHFQSRTFWGGMATALLGSLASIPMVTRILFPRITSQCGRLFSKLIQPPQTTELVLLRAEDPPGPDDEHLGYSLEEMVDCVERTLRDIGLTSGFARIVLLFGHGSGSLNNPHESAYNCGACSGGRGGPNARAFASMANHPEVRFRLLQRGIEIPSDTVFVGGFHNTCDEDVVFFDLDRIPFTHRKEFEAARCTIDEARARNAHERSRRFESAPLQLSPLQALEHVQTRAEDLSQARPEYNHATNAMCVVGRRSRTRGLFLDRRAFLNDYDPHQDDEEATILARVLAAAVPVCAGISLEYYFSTVDVIGYGCGSKLPHNIVSLLGVMEGAASDLRPGLSQQMIEIHEPMRILFVIETTPAAMLRIMGRNPVIDRLIRNGWVQLAILDPDSPQLQCYENGEFVPYRAETTSLPTSVTSYDWYQGQRNHLGFASIGVTSQVETAVDEETDE